MTMHPLDIIERDLAISRLSTDRPRRPLPVPEPEPEPRSLLSRLLGRRRGDTAIRRAMPWLVASGAIVPGSTYRRK